MGSISRTTDLYLTRIRSEISMDISGNGFLDSGDVSNDVKELLRKQNGLKEDSGMKIISNGNTSPKSLPITTENGTNGNEDKQGRHLNGDCNRNVDELSNSYDGNSTLTETTAKSPEILPQEDFDFEKLVTSSLDGREEEELSSANVGSDLDDSDAEEDKSSFPDTKSNRKRSIQKRVLEWFDGDHQSDTIHRLNVFRKSRKFCDLVILVGGKELYCHRVIVGGASRAIFDELCKGEQETGPLARIPLDVSRPGVSSDAVEIILDYMYTSKLVIPSKFVMLVYKACLQLGVERVTPLCRKHIISELEPEDCIQTRRLASNVGDHDLIEFVDRYIEENFDVVTSCNELLTLPRIQMEITVTPNSSVVNILSSMNLRDGILSTSALSWICGIIQQKGGHYLEDLTEQIQRVPVEDITNAVSFTSSLLFNKRRTSKESEHSNSSNGEGATNGKGHGSKVRLSRSSSMDSVASNDSGESSDHVHSNPDGEWKVVASTPANGSDHVISLCCIGDILCTLSIRLPNNSEFINGHSDILTNYHHGNGAVMSSVSSPSVSTSCSSSVGSISLLGQLGQARCAAGVAELNGKLVCAGGFNQSECLDSVETYDASLNRWNQTSHMRERRARFSVAVLGGILYAIGGSSGSHDHISVERYDPTSDAWSHVKSLLMQCSEAGVAVFDKMLYCVGGVQQDTGVAGIKACQVYNPSTDEWSLTTPLHTGRSSLGVSALGNHLYAVGGSDGWSCLSSSERFDPTTQAWSFTATLNVQRRGLGMTSHNGALYCVGGFDGHSFLTSCERYCPEESDSWTLLSATLNVPRNNVGLASFNGSLYAVGGFSGRHFLATIEVLEESEWTNHDHQNQAVGGASDAGGVVSEENDSN